MFNRYFNYNDIDIDKVINNNNYNNNNDENKNYVRTENAQQIKLIKSNEAVQNVHISTPQSSVFVVVNLFIIHYVSD